VIVVIVMIVAVIVIVVLVVGTKRATRHNFNHIGEILLQTTVPYVESRRLAATWPRISTVCGPTLICFKSAKLNYVRAAPFYLILKLLVMSQPLPA